jgi:CO/xanthine dehydrogenase Mo-binding subunit
MYSFGAQFVEVRVDADLGQIQVPAWWVHSAREQS